MVNSFKGVRSIFEKTDLELMSFHLFMAFSYSLLLTVCYLCLNTESFVFMGYLLSLAYTSIAVRIIESYDEHNKLQESLLLLFKVKDMPAFFMLTSLMVFICASVWIVSVFYVANVFNLSLNISLVLSIMPLVFVFTYQSLKQHHSIA